MKTVPSEMFKALSVDTRIRIIRLLKAGGPLGSKKIAAALGITPAAVSQHLRALKQAGLVSGERKGYWVPYSIDVRGMEDCCCMVEEVCRCSCGDSPKRKASSSEGRLEVLAAEERVLAGKLEAVRKTIAELRKKAK